MVKKYDFFVSTNGRVGHCSCGKSNAKLVEVEFVNCHGEMQKESLPCCVACFMKGGFVQYRFFQILGIANEMVGNIKEA